MIWEISSTSGKARPTDEAELAVIRDYFDRVGATKYAPTIDNKTSFTFEADMAKVNSSQAKFLPPEGFEVGSADFDYMPMAWGGDYEL